MAFLAWQDGVASYQGKSRDGMIEGRYAAPASLAVTLLAAIAELARMPIILSVT